MVVNSMFQNNQINYYEFIKETFKHNRNDEMISASKALENTLSVNKIKLSKRIRDDIKKYLVHKLNYIHETIVKFSKNGCFECEIYIFSDFYITDYGSEVKQTISTHISPYVVDSIVSSLISLGYSVNHRCGRDHHLNISWKDVKSLDINKTITDTVISECDAMISTNLDIKSKR